MTGPTHLLGGIASASLLAVFPNAPVGLLCAVAGIGALLPDLDAPGSTIARLQIGGTRGGIRPLALPALFLNRVLGHRGMLHSFLGLSLAGICLALPLAFLLGWEAGLALFLGYASHLALDAMTLSGIPLLFPDRTRRHLLPRFLRIVTGSPEEGIVTALLGTLALALLLPHLISGNLPQ